MGRNRRYLRLHRGDRVTVDFTTSHVVKAEVVEQFYDEDVGAYYTKVKVLEGPLAGKYVEVPDSFLT
jgi:hypothetical protein